MRAFSCLLTAFCIISAAESAKILVFLCQLARSHQIVFHPIIKELAARGHEVDFYSHFPVDDPPPTLTQIVFPNDEFESYMRPLENLDFVKSFQSVFTLAHTLRTMKEDGNHLDVCYTSAPVKELLASKKHYDVVMGEFSITQEEFSYFVHKFNALGVMMQSLPDNHWLNELSGLPNNPAYMLSIASNFSGELNFQERLINFLEIGVTKMYEYYSVYTSSQRIADQYLRYEGWETRPPILKMVSDMALILVSAHHSVGFPYPSAPHVKDILGVNVNEYPPPLPKDIQEFMDSAEHGVIYFGLGTYVSVRTLKAYNAYEPFLKVLSGLKQKVLWKWTTWSGEVPPEVPNIKFLKWMPQQSILAHNKTKLFITHGGLGGLTEAVFHGIPMIGFPLLGDQQKNVKLIASMGIGLASRFDNVTVPSITWAINEVLNNASYKKEALRRSDMFKDRPMKPVDEAVYWVEYILRNGKVMQPVAARMPFYQLYLLDVIGTLVAVALFVIIVLILLFKVLYRLLLSCMMRRSTREKDD